MMLNKAAFSLDRSSFMPGQHVHSHDRSILQFAICFNKHVQCPAIGIVEDTAENVSCLNYRSRRRYYECDT